MTEIELDLTKTIDQNAARYFEAAKKAKKKLEGARKALEISRRKLADAEKTEQTKSIVKEKKELQWYEKFRWFISSEGFLCIGGRDSTSNDIIVKKHADKNDLVFHTEAPGSPFFIIKTEGKKPGKESIEEAAIATVSYSRAWKLGISTTEVYHVSPEQVSKEAKAGEHLAKGAFMIYGKRNYVAADMKLAVGLLADGRIMGGPVNAVKKHCQKHIEIIQGNQKPSDIAKKIQKALGGELDEIIKVMPAGNSVIHQ